jgi:putative tryptophan/tyrosine transport system substrate-binding protein
MNRRVVGSLVLMLIILALGIRAVPFAADAELPTTAARIGWLSLFGDAHSPVVEAFRQGLRAQGYVEGQHITLEYRGAEGNPHQLAHFAAELVRRQVEVIVLSRTLAIRAAKTATTVIPIVMVAAGDPVGTGLITSLARPGGNITGLATLSTDLSGKRLELLKEAVPHLSRVAVLWNSADSSMGLKFAEMQVAAQALGVTLQHLGVRDASDVDWALTMMAQHRPEALFMITNMLTTPQRRRLLDFAAAHRIPVMYEVRELAEEGGLLAYGPNLLDQARRAAAYVDKLLKGAKPADLPVEEPTRLELVVNLKTAEALGLTIPPMLLFQADEVIR